MTAFSDEDVALMLEGLARKLEDGYVSQSDASKRLATLLTEMDSDELLVHEGRLKSQGRVSFGRSNEGRVGTAVFVEGVPDDE